MSYCEVEPGVRLYYEDFGGGEPFLFVHGGAMSHAMWARSGRGRPPSISARRSPGRAWSRSREAHTIHSSRRWRSYRAIGDARPQSNSAQNESDTAIASALPPSPKWT